MPVRLPAKLATPPGPVNSLLVSDVMVSAMVAPSPTPTTAAAAVTSPGRGAGTGRRVLPPCFPLDDRGVAVPNAIGSVLMAVPPLHETRRWAGPTACTGVSAGRGSSAATGQSL